MMSSTIAIRTIYLSIASHLVLVAVKLIAGIKGHAFALVADGIESSTDVFSSLLLLLGLYYSRRPPDENHPYGHGKIEPLLTFVVVAFLTVSALFIAYQSIYYIQTPHQAPEPWTLIVLGAIILWKEISYRYVSRKGKSNQSTVLNAEAWHHRSDAITSAAAFVGIGLAWILGEAWAVADDWAALLASGFILYNAYLIFRPALGEVMDENLHEDLIEEIRSIAIKVKGVKATEKCLVRKVGMKYHVDLHAEVKASISVAEGHAIAHALKDRLQHELQQLEDVHIHIEPHASTS
ncbi:MAG: cation diffusion facilitator family transporter [Flavobacteriaceae bacterium]|nr:cation diffusion facilitator family transporter [Flavobacteriaceae bacterium]